MVEEYRDRMGRIRPRRRVAPRLPHQRLSDIPDLVDLARYHHALFGLLVPALTSRRSLERVLCVVKPHVTSPNAEIGQPIEVGNRRIGQIRIKLADECFRNDLDFIDDAVVDEQEQTECTETWVSRGGYWIMERSRISDDDWAVIAKYTGERWVNYQKGRGSLYGRTPVTAHQRKS